MGFTLVNELPTPAEILEQFPLADHLAALKKERDEEIKKVITGQSNKFLVIIGPCSADNEDASATMRTALQRFRRLQRIS